MKRLFNYFSEPLSIEEQIAFRQMAREIIFHEPIDIPINQKTVPIISQKIQNEFIGLHNAFQESFTRFNNRILNFTPSDGSPPQQIKLGEGIRPLWCDQHMQLSLKEFAKMVKDISIISFGVYGACGFTPKLSAAIPGEKELELNCFGKAIFVAACCRRRGIKVQLAISPDHPGIVVHHDDGLYIDDKKIKGFIRQEQYGTIYRPAPVDKMPSMLSFIFDFDQALVYELLENIEMLRQVSLGNYEIILPGALEKTREVAGKHLKVLQLIDWKQLQRKLVPNIVKIFHKYHDEWHHEVARMADARKDQYVRKIFKEAAECGWHRSVFAFETFDDAQKKLMVYFRRDAKYIKQFMEQQIPFPDTVSNETRDFFPAFREIVAREDSYVLEGVCEILEERIPMSILDDMVTS